MNLLTSGVMQSLVGASTSLKSADVSMSVYQQAKNKGDSTTMERALGYTCDSMNDAAKAKTQAQQALEESQAEAKDQAKAEQKTELQQAADKTHLKTPSQSANNKKASSADTVEISKEGKASLDSQTSDIPNAASSDIPAPVVTQEAGTKVYTPEGKIRHTSIEPNLSVTA